MKTISITSALICLSLFIIKKYSTPTNIFKETYKKVDSIKTPPPTVKPLIPEQKNVTRPIKVSKQKEKIPEALPTFFELVSKKEISYEGRENSSLLEGINENLIVLDKAILIKETLEDNPTQETIYVLKEQMLELDPVQKIVHKLTLKFERLNGWMQMRVNPEMHWHEWWEEYKYFEALTSEQMLFITDIVIEALEETITSDHEFLYRSELPLEKTNNPKKNEPNQTSSISHKN